MYHILDVNHIPLLLRTQRTNGPYGGVLVPIFDRCELAGTHLGDGRIVGE